MSEYPIEIGKFQNLILKIKGIRSIISGIDNLEDVDCDVLTLSNYSHLPHAALLRTNGGLKGEILCQFEFVIENNSNGLMALEFLAWFIRDQARNGVKIQLRPFALPPDAPNGRQLGTSLKFHIDLFQNGISDSLQPLFDSIKDISKTLELAINLYAISVND